ncbi:MAG: formyltransferase family protein [Rhodoglobus sp.]
MSGPTLVVAGKTSMAVAGAIAVREAADARGHHDPVLVVPNRTDEGRPDWQPSLRHFAQITPGFEIVQLKDVYSRHELHFFSLEFDRLLHTEQTTSTALFNIHFSLLPADKGMSTSIWPILDGRSESGVTLHRIARGIDTGPIIAQTRFGIGADDTGRDLYLNYIRHGTELFVSHIDSLLDGTYVATSQPAEGSSYHSKSDLDYGNPVPTFARTAYELRNRIRAFTFPEYQSVIVDGLRVTASHITDDLSSEPPGAVTDRGPGSRRIATIDFELVLIGEDVASIGDE